MPAEVGLPDLLPLQCLDVREPQAGEAGEEEGPLHDLPGARRLAEDLHLLVREKFTVRLGPLRPHLRIQPRDGILRYDVGPVGPVQYGVEVAEVDMRRGWRQVLLHVHDEVLQVLAVELAQRHLPAELLQPLNELVEGVGILDVSALAVVRFLHSYIRGEEDVLAGDLRYTCDALLDVDNPLRPDGLRRLECLLVQLLVELVLLGYEVHLQVLLPTDAVDGVVEE